MKRRIVFLTSSSDFPELKRFIAGEGKEWEVFSFFTGRGWVDPRIEPSRFRDPSGLPSLGKGDDVEIAGDFLRKLEERDFADQPFRRAATFRGLDLWDLQESNFLKFKAVPLVRNLRILKRLLQEEKLEEVALLEGRSVLKELIRSFASVEGFPVRTLPCSRRRRILDDRILTLSPNFGRWKGKVPLPRFVWRTLKPLKDRAFLFASRTLNVKRGACLPKDPGKRRIVFVSIDRRNLEPVLPVFREIERRSRFLPLFVDYNFSSALPVLRQEGIPCYLFDGFAPGNVLSLLKPLRIELRQRWEEMKNHAEFLDSVELLGVPVGRPLEGEFSDLFLRIYPRIARHVETVGNLKRVLDPACLVLTGERHTFGRTVAAAARVFGMKSLCVQHGAIFPNRVWEPRIFTDRMAVYGEAVREVLLRYGNRAGDIVVTGEPRFDRVSSRKGMLESSKVRDRFGIPQGASLVVLATQPPGFETSQDENLRFCRGVIEAIRRLESVFLLIKLHPLEEGSLQRSLLREGENRIRMVRDFDLYSIINACDVFVTAFSTTGMEALFLEKFLITVNLTSRPDPIPYAGEGAALGVYREEDILEAIQRGLTDGKTLEALARGRERFIQRYAHSRDGKASIRIGNCIEEMLGEGERGWNRAAEPCPELAANRRSGERPVGRTWESDEKGPKE